MTKKEYDKITRLIEKKNKLEKLLNEIEQNKNNNNMWFTPNQYLYGIHIYHYSLESEDIEYLFDYFKLKLCDIENKLKGLGYYD